MSKKLFIIIVSIILVLSLAGLVGYYFITQNNSTGTENNTSIFKKFFPFGGTTPTETPIVTETPINEEPSQTANYTQKLRKITSEPVAGAGVIETTGGSVIRYIEKITGHIFEVELFSPNQSRISNTTLPMVYNALWNDKNTALVGQYLKNEDKTIDTYSLLIKPATTTVESVVSAIKLPEDLLSVSVNGNSVFFLEKKGDLSLGYISNFDGSKKTQVWTSPIKELLLQYINSKTVSLTTKPEQNTNGFMFLVNTETGQTKEVLRNIIGLSTLIDSAATQILYLDQKNSPLLYVYNIKNKTINQETPVTFPEKCVWSKKDSSVVYCAVPEEFLDKNSLTSWYLGDTSFTDNIWKYDLKSNTSSIVGNLFNESNEQIDVIKPLLSEKEQYLVFMNKIDGSLWSLDLTK